MSIKMTATNSKSKIVMQDRQNLRNIFICALVDSNLNIIKFIKSSIDLSDHIFTNT